MKVFPAFLSFFIVLALISLLSYGMAPQSDGFQWAFLNPMEAIENIMFLLSFGLGFPVWLSITLIVFVILLLWYGIYLLLSRLFRKRSNE